MDTAAKIAINARLRATPFTRRVKAAGVTAFSVYNRMLLPIVFESIEADCRHLKRHVQVWDVACERQVEIRGPDARRLVQMLTPRDLGSLAVGRCFYVPMVDEAGGMLNDPVLLKLSADRYWVSIADSDLLLWIKGVAFGLKLDVAVFEPDVSPLAVQGPRAEDLMVRVFGEAVRDIRFFRYAPLSFQGRDLIVARSGYSKQGGFEIYVEGADLGEPLWDRLFEAGADLRVRAGGPNPIERIESGLLSYGGDMTAENSPYECGLDRFCDTARVLDCIGRDALLEVAVRGPARQIRSLAIAGEPVPNCDVPWPVRAGDRPVGQVTSAIWSPEFETNVGLGMIDRSHWDVGVELTVEAPDGPRGLVVQPGPFTGRATPG